MNEFKIAALCDGDDYSCEARTNIPYRVLVDWYIADLYIEQSLIIDEIIYMLALLI